jgi:hypothetical protein
MNKNNFRLSIIAAAVLGVTGCLGGGGSKDSGTTTGGGTISGSSVFPSGLAVTSPTARSTTSSTRIVAAAMVSPNEAAAVSGSHYQQATKIINDLLAGTADPKLVFDPRNFFETATNANCYGPTLKFTGHPEYVALTPPPPMGSPGSSPDGELPSGDLGIWKELEGTQACAAAELNSRMKGVSSRTLMGLMGLASMIAVANKNSLALPTAGTSLDLKSYMSALGLSNITFTTATLALDTTGTIWSYTLALTANDRDGKSQDVSLTLTHKPGSSETVYEGLLNYSVTGSEFGGSGNCNSDIPGPGPGPAPGPGPMATGDTESTMNGTLYYTRSASGVVVNSREGGYCGKGIIAPTVADSGVNTVGYLLLDPSVLYDPTVSDTTHSTSGWANNFSIMAGKFNPATMQGDYVYAWQAGKGDGFTRTFQMHVNADAATGDAYFGFGKELGTTDGSIDGMICNWAGPGATKAQQDYAQHQPIKFDATAKEFVVDTAGSQITFAPTSSCAYEGGGFMYDRDLNGSADSSDVVIVHADGTSNGLTEKGLDLMKKSTTGTMQETINANGSFTLPPF